MKNYHGMVRVEYESKDDERAEAFIRSISNALNKTFERTGTDAATFPVSYQADGEWPVSLLHND